ncbi:tetratricopeptide repeat protein [bacterium SCSIO 12741]|nr:tetratricopeptide repeat protein [bacterium SCSIO 12741]
MKIWLVGLVMVLSVNAKAQLSAEKYVSLARSDLQNQNYTSAIQRLNFALRARPYLTEAYFLRGMAKYQLEDFLGAREDYTQCIRLNPLVPAPFQNRGLARAQLNDHYGAIEDFNRAIKLDPGDYFTYINKAFSQLQINELEAVIVTCDRAASLNPYLESAFMLRGVAYAQSQKYNKAIEDFTQTLKINPKNDEAYLRRAMVYNEKLEYTLALTDCDSAISIDSSSSLGYFVRGNIFADRLMYEEALAEYDQVIRLNPNNALAYYNRGNIRGNLGNVKGAAYDYKRVTEINPENILGHFNLALSYHKLEKYEKAEAEYSKVIALFPDMEDAWFNRAFVRKELGDEKGAQADYMKGNSLRGKNREREYNLEDEEMLKRFTEMDADFYNPDFNEEENQFIVYAVPFFRIEETDYSQVTRSQLEYNIEVLNQFNEATHNLPYFYVTHHMQDVPEGQPELRKEALENLTQPETDELKAQRTLLWKAIWYHSTFDFNQSLASYDSLIAAHPDFYLAYFNRGNTMLDLLELLLKLDAGEGAFIDVGDEITPVQLKDVQTVKLQLAQIEEMYQKTLELQPDFYYAWFNIGIVRAEQGNFNGAVEAYSKAIKVNPEFKEAYYNRALTYLYLKSNKKACNDLSRAGELGMHDAYSILKKYCNQ